MKCSCKICGKTFDMTRVNRVYCSKRCANKASRRRNGANSVDKLRSDTKKRNVSKAEERRLMMKRLRERDAEYERKFPNTVRGGMRGRGWGAVPRERLMRPAQ